MAEAEFVVQSEPVADVPRARRIGRARTGRRGASRSVVVPFDAHPPKRHRLVMVALLLVGAAGITAAIVAVRRRRTVQARHGGSPRVAESPEELELLAHGAADI
jgi:hypothetical protein